MLRTLLLPTVALLGAGDPRPGDDSHALGLDDEF